MASLIEMKYGTGTLSLNVDGVFRVEEDSTNAVCFYNTPSASGEVWAVTVDMSENVTASDAAALELLIKRAQQAEGSKTLFELPSNSDATVSSMAVSSVAYP
jgi:hypothetical protein